jgi:AraC family L-rhamnose operon transcriptional activator RhaR
MPLNSAMALAQSDAFHSLNTLHVQLALGHFEVRMLYWGRLGQRWWRNYLHRHSFFEVCYAFGGQGEYVYRGQAHAIKAARPT